MKRGLGAAARRDIARLDRRIRERGRFFAELVAVLHLDDDPDGLWAEYRSAMPGLTPGFPGVVEGLQTLKAEGWGLAVLSNGQADNQLGKLREAGILELFDLCRISGDTGLRKPDPASFIDLLTAAEVSAGPEVWMVGDDPRLDIRGAAEVGVSTLWISHGRDWPADLPGPTVTAGDPAEALQRLRR
ncbi:hypothetical protein GCM10022223_24080 [Kineosporia mesophila]|uniref:Hydrolase of the HAD superfamily n=1 Tax=Kineosporia mesophila TaxID=566012 RepID=A0ABP6ZK99_9ACTN